MNTELHYDLYLGHFPINTLLHLYSPERHNIVFLRVRNAYENKANCKKCAFHTSDGNCTRTETLGPLCYCSAACRPDGTSIYFEEITRNEWDDIEKNSTQGDRFLEGYQLGLRHGYEKATEDITDAIED